MAKSKGKKATAELLTKLKDFYIESEKATEYRREKWKKHYSYWINRALSVKRPKYKSDMRVNYCWVITQVKAPVMTQNRPTVNFISFDKSPDAEDRAKKMSDLIGNALWSKLKIQDKLVDVILDGEIYDAGFWKIGWDPDANNGLGEVFVSSIEPFKVLPDPAAKTFDEGCRYVIHIEPYPVSYLKSKYPKFAEHITTNKVISDLLFEDRKYGDRKPTSGYFTVSSEFVFERAYLKEYWLAASECDQSIMETVGEEEQEQDIVDEVGNVIGTEIVAVEVQAPKYRYGRIVTTINDEVIVDDKPNPYNHGKFPFVRQIVNKVANEFWGIGDIEQIIPLQDALNHAWQQVDDIATKTANPGWTVDPSLGKVAIDNLQESADKPGMMKIVPIDKIRADRPPQLPQYLITRIRDLIREIGIVSGITEILQGRDPKHRTARGMERIFEAATSRIGLSDRLKDDALKDVAFLMAEVVQQYYTEERTYAIIGTTGIATDTITITEEDLTGKFEASIDSGSALPRDKQSKADLVFNLLNNHIFEMALSDDPAAKEQAKVVLNAVEFPGREALLNWQSPAPPPAPAMPPAGAPPTGLPPAGLPPGLPAGLPGMSPTGIPSGPAAGMPTGMPPAGAPPTGGLPPEVMAMIAQSGLSPEEFLAMLQVKP